MTTKPAPHTERNGAHWATLWREIERASEAHVLLENKHICIVYVQERDEHFVFTFAVTKGNVYGVKVTHKSNGQVIRGTCVALHHPAPVQFRNMREALAWAREQEGAV